MPVIIPASKSSDLIALRADVVGSPTTMGNGKTTRAWVRHEGETVQREAVWESWQRVRVVRTAA